MKKHKIKIMLSPAVLARRDGCLVVSDERPGCRARLISIDTMINFKEIGRMSPRAVLARRKGYLVAMDERPGAER